MYFEPTKKTYYRFPSARNVTDNLNSNLYYPDKPSNSEDDAHINSKAIHHVTERETHYDI